MDERELEGRVRAGLERRAAAAEVGVPVVERVRDEVAARRRTRRGVGAAAAAVLVVAGGIGVLTQQAGGDDPDGPSVADGTRGPEVTEVTEESGLRTEYWGAVSVDVPADWGYGGAPISAGGGSERVACWPAAMVLPDGTRPRGGEDPQLGYVGRPVTLTDVCAVYPWIEHSPQEEPTAPYVWLGAAVEPGIVEYDNGYVQETVVLAGSSITVGTDDPGLRARILESASDLGSPRCRTSYADVPGGTHAFIDTSNVPDPYAWVCAYRRTEDGLLLLSYAAPVSPSAAARAVAAQEAAPRRTGYCDDRPSELVVLLDGDGAGWARRTVYETGCAGGLVHLGGGVTTTMVGEGVEPWARNGIPAVVHGPTGGKGAMLDSFIGPQG